EHVKFDTALLQQQAESDDKGGLAAAAHRDVAHANHGACESPGLENSAIVERVSNGDACAENVGKRVHGTWAGRSRNRGWRAASVRAVAPAFCRKASRARWPSRRRSSSSSRNCRSTPARLPGVTVVMAPRRSNSRTISRKL